MEQSFNALTLNDKHQSIMASKKVDKINKWQFNKSKTFALSSISNEKNN